MACFRAEDCFCVEFFAVIEDLEAKSSVFIRIAHYGDRLGLAVLDGVRRGFADYQHHVLVGALPETLRKAAQFDTRFDGAPL